MPLHLFDVQAWLTCLLAMQLVCAVTSTKEDQRQIEFSDALVQPFSKSDEVRLVV
jgi:hypothetical protein